MNSAELNPKSIAVKGSILHFIDNPTIAGEENSYQFFEDGLMVIEDGIVKQIGKSKDLEGNLSETTQLIDYSGKLILPGFIDTHIHYPQTDIIASYGKQLLDWLSDYTFPREGMFSDPDYASEVADFFLEELLRNGTTTAQMMCTVHKQSADIIFQKADQKNLRMISGKMMMDREAPDFLVDDPQSSFDDSLELAEKWHGHNRLLYAVTPRFALTSTPEQLKKAEELLEKDNSLYFHTHLSENRDEIAMVAKLFPEAKNYLDVYDQFSLITERSTFAHSIHLSDGEFALLAKSKAAVSFCPSSNLFIGSGLFDLEKIDQSGINVGIGSDVGGGTSFSMLKTLSDAYKVLQLKGQNLTAFHAFYLATLGGAKSLQLDDKIGNLLPGKEADFIVLNYDSTPLIQRRMKYTKTLAERLFVLMMLGDDRSVEATHILGEKV